MAVVKIKHIRNAASGPATVSNRETPHDTDGDRGRFAVGEAKSIEIWIPWCGSADDAKSFASKHLDVTVDLPGAVRTFSIWQASHADGDRVRVSTDGRWADPGNVIGGFGAVGIVETIAPMLGDDRALVITNDGVWLLPLAALNEIADLAGVIAMDGYHLCGPPKANPVDSVPKRAASAFSTAGWASDALDARRDGARFLYRDSGKRYDFTIADGGHVTVQPAPAVPALAEAISFNDRRRGDAIPLPVFDLIAANNGRVFAKEKGTGRFFFAIVDEMFVHAAPGRAEFAVPSTYFKLDPEFNTPGAKLADVLAPLDGDFAQHPAAERFGLFRFGLSLNVASTFDVRVKRGAWHLIDARPPLFDLKAAALQKTIGGLRALGGIFTVIGDLTLLLMNPVQDLHAPDGVPVFEHQKYCGNLPHPDVTQKSIDFRTVLDIGVGHVHLHDQYEGITGGELQSSTATPRDFFTNYAELYRFMNGPIDDRDGYNDGTCNYYVLAKLSNGAFGLLYMDEQSFFSQRWRLVGPDDRAGLMFALVCDLDANPDLYGWRKELYWSPFTSGDVPMPIGDRSRLAVSAQVVLVTSHVPDRGRPGVPLLYSSNFSWGTMDRTWRWRAFPTGAAALPLDDPANLAVPAWAPADSVFPQTVVLRHDMTITLAGTQGAVAGRWFQRYLPAGNAMPPVSATAGRRPAFGYSHTWKFVAERAFRYADRYSHFGVYAPVDSRMKYYPVDVAPADAAKLEAIGARPDQWWADDGTLFIERYVFNFRTLRLPWPPLPPFPTTPLKPASLFNEATMLRIVRRGNRWIAMHWDKRDDDMLPLTGLPAAVLLRSRAGDATVTVTLHPAVRIPVPPAVQTAYFWWDDASSAGLAFSPPAAAVAPRDNVWRVRMASFDDAGNVVDLVDATFDQFQYRPNAGAYVMRWKPDPGRLAALRTYANAPAAASQGTSIWFEDLTGHVAPPDALVWSRPAEMVVSVTPAAIPLGIATKVTVRAADATTNAVLSGTVRVEGRADQPKLGEEFVQTFAPVSDDERPHALPRPQDPSGTVHVDGYPETPVPFAFYRPALKVTVDGAPVPAGKQVTFTVQAEDERTHEKIPAVVTIGANHGTANAGFPCTFALGANAGTVSYDGYPTVRFTVNAYRPALRVTCEPAAPSLGRSVRVIVRAVDANTGATVRGRVKIDGKDVGATEPPGFDFVFRLRRAGTLRDPVFIAPHGVVVADGYPDAPVPFDLGEA